jgi:CRISPR-associated endonuclease/helicase Cas3
MSELLEALVEAQAMLGGSVVLLSATVPVPLRHRLIAAFACGRDLPIPTVEPDIRYPLATHLSGEVLTAAGCDTRPNLVRRVAVKPLYSEPEAVKTALAAAASGQCVCWIRNTVEDARRGCEMLRDAAGEEHVKLFHSRFAMGERLEIESDIVRSFGRESGSQERQGKILVATQVVEQSLDLDFDVMVSDLAPVDLVIQRAGRLQRHARMADGSRAADEEERRGAPVLHLLCPEFTSKPEEDWYARMFPRAQYVYPDTGKLWLTEKALLHAGGIVTPGEPGMAGSVRSLVEAVYGEGAEDIPQALKLRVQKQQGKELADKSQAKFNTIRLRIGYQEGQIGRWYDEESRILTRLSDEEMLVYLAREENGSLQPFLHAEEFAWELSAARFDARRMDGLAKEWEVRFGAVIEALRRRYRLLEGDAFVLPMVREGERWVGMGIKKGNHVTVIYEKGWGLGIESAR